MKLLFIHPHCASQFYPLLTHLAKEGGHRLMFLSSIEDTNPDMRSVDISGTPIPGLERRYFKYRARRKHKGALAVQRFADEIYQGKAVYDACQELRKEGFLPDVIVAHGRWGAALFLKEAFPEAPLLLYSEYFSTAAAGKICLMPGQSISEEIELMYRVANATNLISLEAADWVVSPTEFQKQSHPKTLLDQISVIHDGIDTDRYRPSEKPMGEINLSGTIIPADGEVITYVTREFESYRGFETLIRAVSIVQKQRPDVRVVIAGGGASEGYGGAAGAAYKDQVLKAVPLDMSRVHFTGVIPPDEYRLLLQRSTVHVYLTVPFVLSWSLLEAMACGCAIVGSRTAPVEEAITHGTEGLLADFLDAQEVADYALKLLSDPKLRAQLGAAARRKVEGAYSIASIAPQYKDLLARLAASSR